jgi:uncharacterized UPF0160 family protein
MDVKKEDITKILDKLEKELKELPNQNDNSTLIEISAEFKEIKEVIQYFETSIDSLKTQNEDFKEIMKETIKDILTLKQKMLEGTITRPELNKKLADITDLLSAKQSSFPERFKIYMNTIITPKIVIISIAIIMFISLLVFQPEIAKDVAHEFAPVAKKALSK